MTDLQLITTDDRAKVVGRIRLVGGTARFTGAAAERIFRTVQKNRAGSTSDTDIFALLAKGWSNGPLKLV